MTVVVNGMPNRHEGGGSDSACAAGLDVGGSGVLEEEAGNWHSGNCGTLGIDVSSKSFDQTKNSNFLIARLQD